MEKEHLEMILEDINGKFDLILEGYDSLDKKIDKNHQESNEKHAHTAFMLETLNQKIDGVDAKLTAKIDAVAEDLSAHRRDTEAHQRYQVRED
jgi:hypothetical protein